MDSLEDAVVEEDHDDTRDVERSERGADEELGVVEDAEFGRVAARRGVVHPECDGSGDCGGDDPRDGEHHVDAASALGFGVADRLRHRDEPGTRAEMMKETAVCGSSEPEAMTERDRERQR